MRENYIPYEYYHEAKLQYVARSSQMYSVSMQPKANLIEQNSCLFSDSLIFFLLLILASARKLHHNNEGLDNGPAEPEAMVMYLYGTLTKEITMWMSLFQIC